LGRGRLNRALFGWRTTTNAKGGNERGLEHRGDADAIALGAMFTFRLSLEAEGDELPRCELAREVHGPPAFRAVHLPEHVVAALRHGADVAQEVVGGGAGLVARRDAGEVHAAVAAVPPPPA
jgi:hypothetical protein